MTLINYFMSFQELDLCYQKKKQRNMTISFISYMINMVVITDLDGINHWTITLRTARIQLFFFMKS